jgi:hypothetical protein
MVVCAWPVGYGYHHLSVARRAIRFRSPMRCDPRPKLPRPSSAPVAFIILGLSFHKIKSIHDFGAHLNGPPGPSSGMPCGERIFSLDSVTFPEYVRLY